MEYLGLGKAEDTEPLPGSKYLTTLHRYLTLNLPRLAPSAPRPTAPSILQQSYTLLTLGLDPNSAPLSRSVKVPLTLGFGTPTAPKAVSTKPVLLRLPPDRLLYLLLRWQSLPQSLPHVGRTDEPIEAGVPVAARGARVDNRERKGDGDVNSVRSWVGSMRSVSMGSMRSGGVPGFGWLGKKEEINEDQILLSLYEMFTVLPALLIHPPFLSDRPITELIEAGGYTQLGGIDVRIPLDVLRNLQILELEGYDPRGLLIPQSLTLRSLTVRDVQDADDWVEELLTLPTAEDRLPQPRFPNLRHLSLHSGSMLDFPSVPLSSLTHLDLSHNLLRDLPSALSSLSSLQSLNLSDNLIKSLRSAPSTLGNITTLNLSRNRIDCLVGLERVLGLERVDVRGNDLKEWEEVGRLAVLPHVREIWCSGNPFDRQGTTEDWRVELGVVFAQEGKGGVLLDDRPWTWNESRRIDGEMAARGHTSHPHSRTPSSDPSNSNSTPGHQTSPNVQARSSPASGPVPPRLQPSVTALRSPVASGSNSPVSSNIARQKKRRPRRVINLDEETPEEKDVVGGSVRLPPKTSLEGNGNGASPVREAGSLQVKKMERRRVSASMFEPTTGGEG